MIPQLSYGFHLRWVGLLLLLALLLFLLLTVLVLVMAEIKGMTAEAKEVAAELLEEVIIEVLSLEQNGSVSPT